MIANFFHVVAGLTGLLLYIGFFGRSRRKGSCRIVLRRLWIRVYDLQSTAMTRQAVAAETKFWAADISESSVSQCRARHSQIQIFLWQHVDIGLLCNGRGLKTVRRNPQEVHRAQAKAYRALAVGVCDPRVERRFPRLLLVRGHRSRGDADQGTPAQSHLTTTRFPGKSAQRASSRRDRLLASRDKCVIPLHVLVDD